MTQYLGNVVAYGSGAAWQVVLDVSTSTPTTASTVTVYYSYRVYFNASISDTSNTVYHADPWGSGTNSTNFVGGAGYYTALGAVPNTASATVVYGGGNSLHFVYSVTGIASGGTGPSSIDIYFPLPARVASPPNTPAAPTVSSITSTGCSVAYSAPGTNGAAITGYTVQISTSSAFTTTVVSASDAGSPYVTTALTRKTSYYARVRAESSAGSSAWSAASALFTTLAEIPVMGTAYTAGSITRNSAVISGLSVTDNGGEAPSNARAQCNTTASESGATVVTQGSWSNISIGSLAASTLYYYRCAAYNSAGWSAYPATWKTFTTLSDAPSDMAAPTFSSVTDTSMRATWVAPAMNGATFVAYYYQVSLVDTFASTVTTGTTAALFVDLTGLTPGTRYYVRVRANATPNNGGYGVASQLTTGFAPNSGLRVYAQIDGVIYQGELYTFVGGVRKKLTTMYAHDGVLETE